MVKIFFFITCLSSLSLLQAQGASRNSKVQFPPGFLWGVSTAGQQIEGKNLSSDWWFWEHEKSKNRIRTDAASDHWNQVESDIQLIKEIHATAYRFSIEWSRIEPQEGVFDTQAILHYRNEVNSLLQAGITPIMTLQHFTFPQWVRKWGGWEWEGITEAFENFATLAYTEIAPSVRYWTTVNEPMNYTLGGYIGGFVPPGEKRKISGITPVIRGILKTHARIYHLLHRLAADKNQSIQVGMALQIREMKPWNQWNPLDQLATPYAKTAFNWTFPDAMTTGKLKMNFPTQISVDEEIQDLSNTQDYVGMNYYGGDQIEFSWKEGIIRHDWDDLTPSQFKELGRDIRAKSFYNLVKEVSVKYPGKPILILENGIPDPTDQLRPQFLKDHLYALSKAIQEGAPVQAYCYWTLMDSFEWTQGYDLRFGLFETNYKTFERIKRPSADLFRSISDNNGFDLEVGI